MHDLTVTIIQSDIVWKNPPQNRDDFAKKILSFSATTDLIVLPEMFSTGFSMDASELAEKPDGPTTAWMAQMARERNTVIAGSIIITENSQYYNRLIWMQPNGSYETYDKRHLFRMANEQEYYSAGTKMLFTEIKGWKIRPIICYDLRFPVWCRNKYHPIDNKYDYNCLICVANWPEVRSIPWKTLLQARAMENLSYCIGVNRIGNDFNQTPHSGDSMVVDIKGEIISKTKPFEESVETVTLSAAMLEDWRTRFPAGMDSDEFKIIL